MRGATGVPAYEARGLTKRYGHIEAATDISIEFHPGEITAIVGDNGAGKSTLIKMLTGAVRPDSGTLHLGGREVRFHDPLDARLQGVEVVYQELALAANLDVTANVFLGRELRKRAFGPLRVLDKKRMAAQARAEVASLSINLPAVVGPVVGSMSGGQRQCVAIARSAFWAKDIVLMDEPTAALGLRESTAVLELITSIKERGLAIGLISHALPHVSELADHVVVLRHGRKVADIRHEKLTVQQLMGLIVEGNPAARVG
ncbi:ATP-binding cassette domain-containing protein [Herbiconiux sp. KACC 21604]|uniref:ATP-binding cassette domain-containing protein n=1 Tax=unclassified Herbiconiux TaxID=2618217 RepID=UPI00149203C1|nr:ATP-binding cassette domain-containing protein [Herbiconiux sp. SALV-R1]QJU55283.1 sugar ABC transporter ATP-binding protein [Herbiconiux sp. SALV-R1]WPO86450.1 ATP-binding cassette domain-containing protein [Herbiconiux sp. KACC 21604]